MSNPQVSIIIINYNGSIDTVECLKSLENQTYTNFEVILVDNGSREDDFNKLKKFVEKTDLDIKLIPLEENKGFTGGNNIGVNYCTGEYIVLLNNDTVVENNWLENLIKPFFQNNEKLAVVGSLIKDYYDRQKIAYYGGRLNIFGQIIGFTKEESISKKIFVISAACFIIKKSVIEEIETLFCPEFFPAYHEDIDLLWRLYNLGYEVSVAPDSIVYHKESVTMKRENLMTRKEINLVKNMYLTFYRNLTIFRFLIIFPILITWNLIYILKSLNKGIIKIHIKAIMEFFKNIKKVKHFGNGDFSFLDKRICHYVR